MPEHRFAPNILEHFGAQLLKAVGCSEEDARIVSESLVLADMRGIHSHGLMRLPTYIRRLRSGGSDPRAHPSVHHESGAIAVVDGNQALGHITATFAMKKAIILSLSYGTGLAVCRRSGHFGPAAHYALLAPERGCIGIAMTNASPSMAPWGGRSRLLGNNPLAVAVPVINDHPIVLDMALSVAARGKIRVAAAQGDRIPAGWAYDSRGEPTTNAKAALSGFPAWMGDYKGYGLSIIVDVLSSLLSGAAFSAFTHPVDDCDQPQDIGHFFLAVHIAHFLPLEEFERRAADMLEVIRSSERSAPHLAIMIPGDLEAEAERLSRERGVPVAEPTWHALLQVADALGVPVPEG